ncbi:hypothetical protein JXA32_07345 [Candidatus Sumerlaeota bacterium]|nr:hypothetical protein [Candidatus Sumerlaeota bacterium]
MAFDYLLRKECVIQQGRSAMEIMGLSKNRDMLGYFKQNEEDILKKNPGKTWDQVEVTHQQPDGSIVKTTLGEIAAKWNEIEPVADSECANCRLNFRRRPIGCFSAITYPIRAELEQWWMDHFTPPQEAPSVILSFIHDFMNEATGERVDAQRPDELGEQAILESPESCRRALKDVHAWRIINLPDPEEITSSQILELLWDSTSPGRLLLWGFCLEFGAIQASPEDCERVVELMTPRFEDVLPTPNADGGITSNIDIAPGNTLMRRQCGPYNAEDEAEFNAILKRAEFVMRSEEGDAESVWRFKMFLYACWIALATGSSMVADG